MSAFNILTRRNFVAATGATALTPHAFAEALLKTPKQVEGPYYPDRMPMDTDNDLLIINNNTSQAVGEVTHLGGRILDRRGDPIRNAVVEIWQVDNEGVYLHTKDQRPKADKNFQGFGRFLTGSKGQYYFRTIKPVQYGKQRPAHIHYAIYRGGKRVLTTQCYVSGDERLATDRLVKRSGPLKNNPLIVQFLPIKESKLGELHAHFDIVLD